MKKQISPGMFVSILVVILLVVGVSAWRLWVAPSSVPVEESKTVNGENISSPRAGGGPDAEAFRKRDEYNRTHPGASGSK